MAIQKTEAKEGLRGNERIQQMMEEFPEIHRTVVIKADLIREGIRPSPGSRLAGRWALPEAPWYFDYDKEDIHTAEETREGYVLSPISGHFSNGVHLQFMFDSRSPYEMRYEERGRYRLYRDDQPMEELFFPSRPLWYDRKTSSGKPMPSVIEQRTEVGLMVVPLTYCEYGKDNRQCKYCNVNSSETTKKGLGMERITAKREEDVYESYVAALQEIHPSTHITMSGGVILDSSKEAEAYARLIKALRRAEKDTGHQEVPIGIRCQAMRREDQMKLKEAGASSIGHNLEVWDPRLWEIICPGKAQNVGREKWLESILRTKEIFGSTSSTFVPGVEMAPPYGFKTEDEGAASVLEGFEWMMAHGVEAVGSLWRPAPGTEFAALPSPRTEYFLRLALGHYRLTQEYNMVPKPGRPSYNGTSIISDMPLVPAREAPASGPSAAAGPSGGVC